MILLCRWHFLFYLLCLSVPNLDAIDLPQPAEGEWAPKDPIFHNELKRGIDLVYADQFEPALAALDSLIAKHPHHPGPHFYRAATLQTWMSSRRFNAFQAALEESVEKTIETGNEKLMQDDKDPWLDFYMGGAYGYRAYFKFGRYNFWGAYQDGKKGIAHFRACLKKEPRLYDAYLGLGSYYYWRTARSRVLRWLLFWMDDKRVLGLDQIALAMKHGQYSQAEACLALAAALYDDKQYDRASGVLLKLGDVDLSSNMFGLYLSGLLAFEKRDWQTVLGHFRELDSRLEKSPYASMGYRIECQYRMAKALSEMNQKGAALEMAQSAISMRALRDSDKELESMLWPYDDIKKALDRLYRELD